jgi:hypothetical protein
MNNAENLMTYQSQHGYAVEKRGFLKEISMMFKDINILFKNIFISRAHEVPEKISEEFDLNDKKQIVLEVRSEEFNVRRDIGKFVSLVSDGGKFHLIDKGIVEIFGDVTIAGRTERLVLNVYCFLNKMIHQNIIDAGKKLGVYKKHNLLDALEAIGKIVDSGDFQPGKEVVIYIKEESGIPSFRLYLYCDEKGRPCINLQRLCFDLFKFPEGSGVLYN